MVRASKNAKCGTRAKYLWHLRERKNDKTHVIDDACREANNEYGRQFRSTTTHAVELARAKKRAEGKALRRLRDAEIIKYHAFYQDELSKEIERIDTGESGTA